MILDDHAVIRRMVRELFEAEDLKVFDAANGAEGVHKAQEVKPALIILDLSMPVMNGLDAARELKVLMPHVPLLMFTNNDGGIVEKEARSRIRQTARCIRIHLASGWPFQSLFRSAAFAVNSG